VTCQPVIWTNNTLKIIDQTLLPVELRTIELGTVAEVWDAIKQLQVRGAPAIGICAAFGVLVGLLERRPEGLAASREAVSEIARILASARPTAVNLFWALERMERRAAAVTGSATPSEFFQVLESEALGILAEDLEQCRRIGQFGAHLVHEGAGVLTHCNAGALATGGQGTALSVLYQAKAEGRNFHVFADETRPLLQGARLTAWELQQAGIDTTLICDNAAAQVMREGRVDLVIVGADRIAANGDTANKIGTYGLAVLAEAHDIPLYVAAPTSTLDRNLADGDGIPIEERDPAEITHGFGHATAPAGIAVYNPAFDVTPATLIAGIITEYGIVTPPYDLSLSHIFGHLDTT
jgi:methylthioribose-1-phosphate isomerase